MNLVTFPLRLPFVPLQAVVQLAEVIREQAEQELHDPAAVRRQLEEIEQASETGEVSGEDVAQTEDEAVARLGAAAHRRPARGSGTRNGG
ncbi:MAG TPA: gas vesicle protein GvpG [Streptosporangiaceae bacterium]|jgi:hypothetical protein